jgi:hypothetical protein
MLVAGMNYKLWRKAVNIQLCQLKIKKQKEIPKVAGVKVTKAVSIIVIVSQLKDSFASFEMYQMKASFIIDGINRLKPLDAFTAVTVTHRDPAVAVWFSAIQPVAELQLSRNRVENKYAITF